MISSKFLHLFLGIFFLILVFFHCCKEGTLNFFQLFSALEAVAMACEAELQERSAGEAYEAEQGVFGVVSMCKFPKPPSELKPRGRSSSPGSAICG